jgi:hypothetical protein
VLASNLQNAACDGVEVLLGFGIDEMPLHRVNLRQRMPGEHVGKPTMYVCIGGTCASLVDFV